MTRPVWLLFAFAAGACATLTPEGARVQVYQAPLDRSLPAHDMPRGCTLVSAKPQVSMTELDMQGQKHPFWAEQNEAASVGANVVLVRSRQVVSRHDPDCPGASAITDCPPGSGAWFDVVVERYACTQEALRTLGRSPARSEAAESASSPAQGVADTTRRASTRSGRPGVSARSHTLSSVA
jgi:hypothetical protein